MSEQPSADRSGVDDLPHVQLRVQPHLQRHSTNPPIIKKITECRGSSEKIWIYEEDGATIDDGNGEMWTTNWANADLLSIRHEERGKRTPDRADPAGVPNAKRRGNVLFADGH